ncbi:Apoptosis-inducing factor 2 [Perkinsus chesapeaki]|uniref:Apoptosis-inducing factor 2 n=1 Tax=Perkinsus chesapeaki TaxID=330153 RepID=A0A7J6N2B7_PERCH|nr:Apoptosis-inducing factor 2 [Perkinsus chesapeaki]
MPASNSSTSTGSGLSTVIKVISAVCLTAAAGYSAYKIYQSQRDDDKESSDCGSSQEANEEGADPTPPNTPAGTNQDEQRPESVSSSEMESISSPRKIFQAPQKLQSTGTAASSTPQPTLKPSPDPPSESSDRNSQSTRSVPKSINRSESLLDESRSLNRSKQKLVDEVDSLLRNIAAHGQYPPAKMVDRLRALIAEVHVRMGEAGLRNVKQLSNALSFVTSEWLFYHTLRTCPELTWSGTTGYMDQAFTDDKEKEMADRIAKTFKRAFWDLHREDLQKRPPDYSFVFARLSELRSRMCSFLPQARQPEFASRLDLELLKQQIQHQAFDRETFVQVLRVVVDMLYRLESPASHKKTVEWFENDIMKKPALSEYDSPEEAMNAFHKEIVDSLSFLFEQCDVLEAELQSYRTTQVTMKERRQLEFEHFMRMIDVGVVDMSATKKMFRSGLLKLGESADSIVEASLKSEALMHQLAGRLLLLELAELCCHGVDKDTLRDSHEIPEPLRPDTSRLIQFAHELLAIAELAAIAVVLHQLKLPTKLTTNVPVMTTMFDNLWRVIEAKSVLATMPEKQHPGRKPASKSDRADQETTSDELLHEIMSAMSEVGLDIRTELIDNGKMDRMITALNGCQRDIEKPTGQQTAVIRLLSSRVEKSFEEALKKAGEPSSQVVGPTAVPAKTAEVSQGDAESTEVPKSPRTPLAGDSPANTEAARAKLAVMLLPRGCLGKQPWTLSLVEGKMRLLLQVFLSFVGDHMCVYAPIYVQTLRTEIEKMRHDRERLTSPVGELKSNVRPQRGACYTSSAMGSSFSAVPRNFQSNKKLVVVGGGYAGQGATILGQDLFTGVTQIEARYAGLVHKIGGVRACVRPEWGKHMVIPQNTLFKSNVQQIFKPAIGIDVPNNTVIVDGGQTVPYDYLVIATGAVNTGPADPPVSYTMTKQILDFYQESAKAIEEAKEIMFIGGGPVAIEIIGEINQKYPSKKLSIVTKGNRILQPATATGREGFLPFDFIEQVETELKGLGIYIRSGVSATNITREQFKDKPFIKNPGEVQFSDGSSAKPDLVFLCMGSEPNTSWLRGATGLPDDVFDNRGRVKVDDFLHVAGHQNIFAIGDCNTVNEEKMMATAGTQVGKPPNWPRGQADSALENIVQQELGTSPKMYRRPDTVHMAITLGHMRGVTTGLPAPIAQLKSEQFFVDQQWHLARKFEPHLYRLEPAEDVHHH